MKSYFVYFKMKVRSRDFRLNICSSTYDDILSLAWKRAEELGITFSFDDVQSTLIIREPVDEISG